MRHLLLITLLISSLFALQNPTSVGYTQVKSLTSVLVDFQSVFTLRTKLLNISLPTINSICKNSGETQCVIDKDISILVTQELYDLGLKDDNFTVGSTLDLPSGTFTFQNLPNNSNYNYSISMDLTKLNETGTEKFFWSKNTNNKQLVFNNTNVTAKLVQFDKNNSNNIAFSFKDANSQMTMTMKQYDISSAGVDLTVFFKDNDLTLNTIAKADNNGGYINTKYTTLNLTIEEKETFDSNGTQTSYTTNDGTGWTNTDINSSNSYYITNDDINDISIHTNSNFTMPNDVSSYVIVEENKEVNEHSIIGFATYFNGNLDVNYFGDKALLSSSTTTDLDKLDIYKETFNNDTTITYTKVNGAWLSL